MNFKIIILLLTYNLQRLNDTFFFLYTYLTFLMIYYSNSNPISTLFPYRHRHRKNVFVHIEFDIVDRMINVVIQKFN